MKYEFTIGTFRGKIGIAVTEAIAGKVQFLELGANIRHLTTPVAVSEVEWRTPVVSNTPSATPVDTPRATPVDTSPGISQYLTIRGATQLVGISRWEIHRRIREGDLPAIRLDYVWLVLRKDVEALWPEGDRK